jgi:phosphoglucosamine mutase
MKYFGTDGVRGEAGTFPLLPETITALGRRVGLQSKGPVLIGRDTRESGQWILSALTAGIMAEGKDVWDLGVCPTPVVARMTARFKKGLGLVISASHNPSRDNGIKVFQANGLKATAVLEKQLEKAFDHKAVLKDSSGAGSYTHRKDLVEEDLQSLVKNFKNLDLSGLFVAVDTAHGAASNLLPQLLLELGASLLQLGGSPNGKNINKNCGSMHLKLLAREVKKHGCHIGFAFDGDADRCLAVDAEGRALDGDALLAILAKKGALVGTVMTNQGLEDHLKKKNIKLYRTDVGDKYVVEKMRQSGAVLGGENSGHLILSKYGYFGDGMLTMLAVLKALSKVDFDIQKALGGYAQYPQVLINIPVSKKLPFESKKEIKKAVKLCESQIKGQGRLLLRYSGTENLARVMVEAKSEKLARTSAGDLATIIKKSLGKR